MNDPYVERWRNGAFDQNGEWHSGKTWFCVEALGLQMTRFREEGLDWVGVPMLNNQYIAWWLAPRGCGKSETGTAAEMTWYICNEPDFDSLLVAESRDLAAMMLTQIKSYLVSDVIYEHYGDMVGDRWSEYRITRRGRKPKKESTIECVGLTGSVVGRHTGHIWCDDVVSLNNVKTKHVRDTVRHWWEMVLLPVLNPGGKMVGRGTRYHPDDLYGYIAEKFPGAILVHKALLEDEEGNEKSFFERSSDGREQFPLKWLQEKRARTPVAFAYQYQNSINVLHTDIVAPGAIQVWEKEPKVTPETYFDYVGFIGLDLAASEKDVADSTACCLTIYQISTDTTYVVELWLKRMGSLDDQMRKVYESFLGLSRLCRVRKILVENNAYQAIFASTMMKDPRFKHAPITPFNQQKDKVLHLQSHTAYINSRKVFVAPHLTPLINKLEMFPNHAGGDDDIDAFSIALTANDMLKEWRSDLVGLGGSVHDLRDAKKTKPVALVGRESGITDTMFEGTHDKLFG